MSKDIYKARAAKLLGIPVQDVTPEQRAQMKCYMFPELYGSQKPFKAYTGKS